MTCRQLGGILVIAAMSATACTNTLNDPAAGPSVTVAQTTTTLISAPPDLQDSFPRIDTTDTPAELAASAQLVPYRFTIHDGDLVTGPLRLTGASDPTNKTAYVESVRSNDNPVIASQQRVEFVTVDGTQYARGLTSMPTLESERDPEVWYELPGDDQVVFDPLGSVQDFDELKDRVSRVSRVIEESEKSAEGSSFTFVLGTGASYSLVGTVLGPFSDFAGQIELRSDADGHISEMTLFKGSAADLANAEVTFQFSDFGQPVLLPTVSDPRPLPDADATIQPETVESNGESTETATTYDPESSAVVFRFWTYLGADDNPFGLSSGSSEFNVVLLADGTVVRVDGTSVFDGAESYVTWRLDETGFDLLLDTLTGNEVVASGRQIGSNDVAYALTSDLADFAAHPERGSASANEEVALHELARAMYDQSWLFDHLVSGPESWMPELVSMRAVKTGFTSEPEFGWPVNTTIVESGRVEDDGSVVLCLEGRAAEEAWLMIREGENHSQIRVFEGEESWTMSYNIAFPGYSLGSDPCR